MKINDATLNLIMEFEGVRLNAYRDPVGIVTIGYGHSERAPTPPVPYLGMTITQDEAEKILAADLGHFAEKMRPLFNAQPNPNEFGAMLSLAFNIGLGAFRKSTCLKRFNAGDVEGAAEALTWFNKADGKVLRGLVRRRAAERDLMLTGWTARAVPDEESVPRTKPIQSTTIQASTASMLGGAGTVFTAVTSLDGDTQKIALGLGAIIILAGMWIFKERIKKWSNGIR